MSDVKLGKVDTYVRKEYERRKFKETKLENVNKYGRQREGIEWKVKLLVKRKNKEKSKSVRNLKRKGGKPSLKTRIKIKYQKWFI